VGCVPLSSAVRREMKLWGTIGFRNESVSQGPEVVRELVARMRGDQPQGHVAACSDARKEPCSQEAQANTTFEISGLVPRYDRVQRAAARSAPKLLVRMVEFRYAASGPPYQRFLGGERARSFSLGVNDRSVATKRLPAHGGGLGVQPGATPGVLPLRLPADQSLLAGAGPAIAWFL
jgi:hypothetical protein